MKRSNLISPRVDIGRKLTACIIGHSFPRRVLSRVKRLSRGNGNRIKIRKGIKTEAEVIAEHFSLDKRFSEISILHAPTMMKLYKTGVLHQVKELRPEVACVHFGSNEISKLFRCPIREAENLWALAQDLQNVYKIQVVVLLSCIRRSGGMRVSERVFHKHMKRFNKKIQSLCEHGDGSIVFYNIKGFLNRPDQSTRPVKEFAADEIHPRDDDYTSQFFWRYERAVHSAFLDTLPCVADTWVNKFGYIL